MLDVSGNDVGARDSEGLAVGQEFKLLDLVGSEIAYLIVTRTVERLEPQVVRAVFVDDVDQRLAGGRKVCQEGRTFPVSLQIDLHLVTSTNIARLEFLNSAEGRHAD
jgi:hypothetical protein